MSILWIDGSPISGDSQANPEAAADVRRLILFRKKEIRASLRRLLPFRDSERDFLPR